jgi:hypothetical protein
LIGKIARKKIDLREHSFFGMYQVGISQSRESGWNIMKVLGGCHPGDGAVSYAVLPILT